MNCLAFLSELHMDIINVVRVLYVNILLGNNIFNSLLISDISPQKKRRRHLHQAIYAETKDQRRSVLLLFSLSISNFHVPMAEKLMAFALVQGAS